MPLRRCATVPLCRCALVPLCRCALVPLRLCAVMLRCALAPLRPCAVMPLRPCALAPLRPCALHSYDFIRLSGKVIKNDVPCPTLDLKVICPPWSCTDSLTILKSKSVTLEQCCVACPVERLEEVFLIGFRDPYPVIAHCNTELIVLSCHFNLNSRILR